MGNVWQRRLGLPSLHRYNLIRQLNIFIPRFGKDIICDDCLTTKLTRLPFPSITSKTSRPFELLHTIIWGRNSEGTHDRHHYFLTIVDDYSRVTWIILLHNKFEVTSKLKHFIIEANNQFDTKVKILHCNNGKEFMSSHLTSFLEEIGNIQQFSFPHTPQQNCVVERKHHRLLDVARCLIFQSHVPMRF